MFNRFKSLPIDWLLLIIPIILTSTGIVTIYTITFGQAKAGLATDQIIFAAIGIVVMAVFMFSTYRFLQPISTLLYLIGLILLALLLPGVAPKLPFTLKVFGAYRWLDFGFFQLQPAEVFKTIAAIFGAGLLSDYIGVINWRRAVSYIIFALLPLLMILFQPDLGTASVVFAVFGAMLLAARPSGRVIASIGVLLLILLTLGWGMLKPYQKDRLETFLNPAADPQGQGYNINQALIAVGSGGLTGRGFGQGSQTVLNFLPVAHTDFVFAGFAEATGFVGSVALLILYATLIWRMLSIAKDSGSSFGMLLAVAITAKFMFQVVVHVGMNIGLLPVTGIPLPFMSYGGTAMILDLATIGILQSIHIRHKKLSFR